MTTAVSSRGQAAGVWAVVDGWRALAIRALRRMYLPDQRLFCYEIERDASGVARPQGVSGRYTAIALIGLVTETPEAVRTVLGEHTSAQVCDALIDRSLTSGDYGEIALAVWAARVLGHARVPEILNRLRSVGPERFPCPTVELAWSLTALLVPADAPTDAALAERIAARLETAYHPRSNLFAHWPEGTPRPWLRSHVTCFADWVYPVQAFSYHYRATKREKSLEMARLAGQRMCDLQGPAGQWWWHYDVRTGRVIEGYPVYAIHQDAMGPMALFALEEASGIRHWDAVRRSCEWLIASPELDGGSLVDAKEDLIWRKVARHEPNKLVRTLQATASKVNASLRVPAMDAIFKPGWIDHESRPYHMGWLLHAFTAEKVKQLAAG